MRIKSLIGLHNWAVFSKGLHFPQRICKSCGVWQDGSYDMSYGETIWKRRKTKNNKIGKEML